MDQLHPEIGRILGASGSEFWSQVHSFIPQDAEKLEKRGQLLAVISLKKVQPEGKVVAFGREIISRLHEEYFGNLEGSILERLKQAVGKMADEIGSGFELEIIAAVFSGRSVFLVTFGEGKVILKRETLAVVCRGKKGEISFSSGYLKKDDLVFLGNSFLFSDLAEGTLRAASAAFSVQEIVENLTPVIYGRKGSGPAVGAVVKIQPERGKETKQEREEKKKKRRKLADRFLKTPKINLNKSRAAIVVAAISIFLLMISLVLGARRRNFSARQAEDREILTEARLKFEEGRDLVDLNPIRARQLLTEAQELIDKVKETESSKEETLCLSEEVEEALMLALRKYQLGELPVFFDLEVVKKNGRGKGLGFSEGTLVVMDSENKAIYGIGVEDKKGEILAGGDDLKSGRALTIWEKNIFVLTPEGIVKMNFKEKIQELVIEADPDWGEITGFWAYMGNLYLFDSEKSSLYRYPVIEGGFGAKQSWLKGGKSDLAGAVSMAVDGSIWILKKEGQILKLTHGFTDPFTIAGLDRDLVSPQRLYTDSNQENLYILEDQGRRIVVLGKDGEYRAQYSWSLPEPVEEIAVSEKAGKIWLLRGSKIYEIGLR